MNPQEILTSLSRLESELQEVASARLLVEQTTQSYKDVQQEIRSFVAEFQNVINSLNSIANAFDSGQSSLSNDVDKSIELIKVQLSTLNETFAKQCNSVVLRFIEQAAETGNRLSTKTESLSAAYAKNNSDFETSIKELSKVHVSLIKALESVTSLKADIATLQSQLNDSQKEQDATLDKIAEELRSTGTKHAQILTQIYDAQDTNLASIKSTLENVSNIQLQQKYVEGQIINGINKLYANIESRMNSIDAKVEEVNKTINTTKIVGIVNIVGILILLILLSIR